jgi:hypothetical protein
MPQSRACARPRAKFRASYLNIAKRLRRTRNAEVQLQVPRITVQQRAFDSNSVGLIAPGKVFKKIVPTNSRARFCSGPESARRIRQYLCDLKLSHHSRDWRGRVDENPFGNGAPKKNSPIFKCFSTSKYGISEIWLNRQNSACRRRTPDKGVGIAHPRATQIPLEHRS